LPYKQRRRRTSLANRNFIKNVRKNEFARLTRVEAGAKIISYDITLPVTRYRITPKNKNISLDIYIYIYM